VHGGGRSGSRRVVRAADPILRNTHGFSESAARDHPEYHAPRDDRPDSLPDAVSDGIPDGIPNGIAYGVPDRLAVRFCDGVALIAFERVTQSARTKS